MARKQPEGNDGGLDPDEAVNEAEAHLRDVEPGQQDGIARPGRSHEAPPTSGGTGQRGRPKKPDRRQASFDDIVLEDIDIRDLLKVIDEGESIAIKVRVAKKELKKLVDAGYPEAVNSDQDGMHSGYVNCLGFRFWAGKITRPAHTQAAKPAKPIPTKESWQPLDVHRADLFSLTKPE